VLKNKKIILGVSGSIAAYKTPALVRLLTAAGAEVQVIATAAALHFATPLSLATVSHRPVLSSYFDEKSGTWHNHVALGLWADALVIAPASANTIGKMANGICDNLLLATYLSARCPTFFAPAMDLDMYAHPSTLRNISTLQTYKNILIPAEIGELASGLHGQGRMAQPEHIVATLQQYFANTPQNAQAFAGKTIMVSAGSTHEPIDPVRYIGNHSTGKMGFEIANALAAQGATVHLVAGITHLHTHHPHIHRTNATTAHDMYNACTQLWAQCDIAIMCAAVADYTPAHTSTQKIKKNDNDLSLALIKTKDILKQLGATKMPHQTLIGFALETQNEIENARKKLQIKNLDAIVLNSMQDPGAGFKHDTNKITILDKHNNIQYFELKPKAEVATDILNKILDLIQQ
jgi:phosphopantothenoylcysteine decarboxylase/phosphopantothenate--cysteine ligase